MMVAIGSMAASVGTASAAGPHRAAAISTAPVDVVEVSGLLDRIEVDYVERSIDAAERDGAQALVLQMNTRAATVSRNRVARLAERIATANVPVAIWVGPSGARAYGDAGQLLAAAVVTGMAPGSRIGRFGAPLPVDPAVVRLDFGAATALLRDGSLGASDALAKGALKPGRTKEGTPVLRAFLCALDGVEVSGKALDTSDVVDTSGKSTCELTAPARFAKLGLTPRLLHTVASAPVAYLLFLIGMLLLVFEFFTAGVGVAGVVGAGSLILGCFGLAALPAREWAIGLLLLAAIGFAVDVQAGAPRFWTGVGTVSLVVGSLWLYRGLSLSWITLLAGIGGALLAAITGMPSMVRTRFATPTIGRSWMIGELGDAVAAIDPDGTVRVREALWRAHTNRATPIPAGGRVRVVAIDGMVLEVEPEEGGARDHRERRRPTA